MSAERQLGYRNLARTGSSGPAPRGHLNILKSSSGERFEIEHRGGGIIHKKAHLDRADSDFHDGNTVAAFYGDFVSRSGLCEKRGREERMRHRKETHDEDSSVHCDELYAVGCKRPAQVTSSVLQSLTGDRPCMWAVPHAVQNKSCHLAGVYSSQ